MRVSLGALLSPLPEVSCHPQAMELLMHDFLTLCDFPMLVKLACTHILLHTTSLSQLVNWTETRAVPKMCVSACVTEQNKRNSGGLAPDGRPPKAHLFPH